jgi:hypothetical protein
MERYALELAAGQAQHVREELNCSKRRLHVPLQPTRRAVLQVVEMPARCVANMRSSHNLAAEDRLGPARDRIRRWLSCPS